MAASHLKGSRSLARCPIHVLPAGTQLIRVAKIRFGNDMRPWASKQSRFDLEGCYFATNIVGCLLECRLIFFDRRRGRYLLKSRDTLRLHQRFRVTLVRDLRVVNITAAIDQGLVDPRVLALELSSPPDPTAIAAYYEDISQPFGRRLHATFPDIDGFYWASRFGGGHNLFLLADPGATLEYPKPLPILSHGPTRKLIATIEAGGELLVA